MTRPRHPHKEIEAAVAYAESLGWRFVKGRGHTWGSLYCTLASREGCKVRVYPTPRNPEGHARQIRREVGDCPHGSDDAGEEE